MAMLKLPIFAMGTTDEINASIAEGGYLYDKTAIMYVYNTDTGMLAFIHPLEKVVHYIVGNNKTHVLRLDTLPPVSEGDTEVLYIVNDIVYTFNGTEYLPTYKELSDVVSGKADKATTLEGYGITDADTSEEVNKKISDALGAITEGETVAEYVVSQIEDAISITRA